MTPAGAPTVFVIDDSAAVRASIQALLKSVGLRAESFGAAQEFLRSRTVGNKDKPRLKAHVPSEFRRLRILMVA
jgi:FixJ family two-component response regulator